MPSIRALALMSRLVAGPRRIDEFDDALREGMLDAGMHEPPLVDTDGPRVFLTAAGREALGR